MNLSEETKTALEIKGEVLKSILNDLNNDRTLIMNSVINDSSTSNNMVYVSSIESLIRQLVNYQVLLDNTIN